MAQSLDLGDPDDWDRKMAMLRRMNRLYAGLGSGGGAPAVTIDPLRTEDGAIIFTEDGQDIFPG